MAPSLEDGFNQNLEQDICLLKAVQERFKTIFDRELKEALYKKGLLLIVDDDLDTDQKELFFTVQVKFENTCLYLQDINFFIEDDNLKVRLIELDESEHFLEEDKNLAEQVFSQICSDLLDLTSIIAKHEKKHIQKFKR